MESERINEIIGLVLSGEADSYEKQIFENWLNHSEENRQFFHVLKEEWEMNKPTYKIINADELKDKIWEKGTGLTRGEKRIGYKKRNLDYVFYLKVAAIFFLFISVPIVIVKQAFKSFESKTEEVWVHKSNPPGQKSKVFLPDGSEAWLNAGSQLRYPEKFTDSTRTIHLNGEAFFEVVKDICRPFVVISNDISITALGTAFNVNGSDEAVNIALVEGMVKVDYRDSIYTANDHLILEPGQAAHFDRNKKHFTIDSFDPDEVIGWKEGILYFNDESFNKIIDKLELWYDVNISLEGNGTIKKHYTGKFKNESLRNVLESMSFALDFEYKLKDKNVLIYVN